MGAIGKMLRAARWRLAAKRFRVPPDGAAETAEKAGVLDVAATSWVTALSRSEYDALIDDQNRGRDFNQYLLDGTPNDERAPKLVPGIAALDRILTRARLPRSFWVYGGTARGPLSDRDDPEEQIGRAVTEPNFMSTSIDPYRNMYSSAIQSRNGRPNRALVLALWLPRHFPAAWLPALGLSPHASPGGGTIYVDEAELLLPRGLTYQVKKVVRDCVRSDYLDECDLFVFVATIANDRS